MRNHKLSISPAFNQATRLRAALLAGAVTIMTAAIPAQAQETEAPPASTSVETTRSTVDGQDMIIVTAPRYVPSGSITANKINIPLIETPQSVSVITRDQIDLLNFIDAQQAVRYTAGVFGENYGPDPRFDFITVRGFTPKQYIDGLAVPATTTIAATGVDLYAFESLDILKGPSSVLYGAAPPGGILNEESRRASGTFDGEIRAKYGTHRFAELATTMTGPVSDNLDARATILYRDTHGEIDFQRIKRLYAAPTATLKLGSSTKLTGLLYYQYDNNMGGNGGFLPAYGTLLPSPTGLKIKRSNNLDDPTVEYTRRQMGIGYDFEHDFSDDIEFRSNTKWSHYREETPIGLYSGGGFINTTDATLPSYYRTLQQYNFSYAERVSSFATDNRINLKFDTGSIRQKLLVGIDYRNLRNLAAYNFVFAGLLDAFDPVYDPNFQQDIGFPTRYNQQHIKQTGVYAQDQIKLGNLSILIGGRYDWVNAKSATAVFAPVTDNPAFTTQKQHKFTYRAGATYVTDSGLAPYVSYATSFEPILGTDVVTSRPFDPTSTKQWEGGVKYDARGLSDDIKLFATAAVFDIKQNNFVSAQVGQGRATFSTQGGNIEVYGAEFELVARIREQLSFNASYSYNHSEVKSSANAPDDVGFPLPTTPKHKASAFVDYTFQAGALGGLGFGAGARYNSKSAGGLPSTTFPQLVSGEPIFTGAATLFDAIIHYDLPGWRFAVNGSNIFDKAYVARCAGLYGCVYGAGRQVIGTVTKKF
jgi:iron complex outermembrane receptor protein